MVIAASAPVDSTSTIAMSPDNTSTLHCLLVLNWPKFATPGMDNFPIPPTFSSVKKCVVFRSAYPGLLGDMASAWSSVRTRFNAALLASFVNRIARVCVVARLSDATPPLPGDTNRSAEELNEVT